MRYRALTQPGRSLSAVTLSLAPDLTPEVVRATATTALEAGVNAFELLSPNEKAAQALGEVLRTEHRSLSYVILRVGGGSDPRRGPRPTRDFSRGAVLGAAAQVTAAGGFGRLDLVLLDAPQPEEAPAETWEALELLRSTGRAGMIGVSGEGMAVDAAVETGRLDVLAATYNVRSGWPQRHRIKAASDAGMIVLGERFLPDMRGPSDAAPPEESRRLGGLFKRRTTALDTDAYAFMRRTPGWSADEICLGYALTEPALASVLVPARTPQDMVRLAEVTDRDLPVGVGAQVEMARFSGSQPPAQT